MQQSIPAHTFVIPAYKESPYLESCIQSLMAQSVKSKIILTTSTPSAFLTDLATRYSLTYFINEQPGSIATDWNFALSKVDTRLATIAHQDDLYSPLYAQSIISAADKHKDSLILFTGYTDLVGDKIRSSSLNSFVKNALLWPFLLSSSLRQRFAKKLILLFGDPISCPTVTFNWNILRNNFAFSRDYTCALDWHAWLELSSRSGSFVYIPQKLVQHRIHPDSETTNQLTLGIRQKEELQIFEQMWGKRFAKLISRLYASGYKDNEV